MKKIIVEVPDELKAKFKSRCQNKTQKQVIIKLIKDWFKNEKNNK